MEVLSADLGKGAVSFGLKGLAQRLLQLLLIGAEKPAAFGLFHLLLLLIEVTRDLLQLCSRVGERLTLQRRMQQTLVDQIGIAAQGRGQVQIGRQIQPKMAPDDWSIAGTRQGVLHAGAHLLYSALLRVMQGRFQHLKEGGSLRGAGAGGMIAVERRQFALSEPAGQPLIDQDHELLHNDLGLIAFLSLKGS